MIIQPQTSLFAYDQGQNLEDSIQALKLFGEPTPYGQVKKLVKKYSQKGDLILDPCCGNGTIGIAALEMNRQAILHDLNPLACQVTKTLFDFCDYNQVFLLWQEIKETLDPVETVQIADITEKARWNNFINNLIPQFAAYRRILNKKIQRIAQIFYPEDLHTLKNIFFSIMKIRDLSTKELLEVVFYHTLIESSQLAISQNQRCFYLPKNKYKKSVEKIFERRLNLFLNFKNLIKNQFNQNFLSTPTVKTCSAFALPDQKSSSVDYVIIHLPGIQGYSEGEMSYLIELLLGQHTDLQEEIILDFNYRGRYCLSDDLCKLFRETKRVLKDTGHFTLLFSSHQVLLTIILQVAGKEGWQLLQENVEIFRSRSGDQIVSLTLRQKIQHTVMGALNKMKIETLYDSEEAVLRKIDHFLTKQRTATSEEIQRLLIRDHLHDCLINRSLEELLTENFLFANKYWMKPTADQKKALFKKRRQVMKKKFPEFVREMTYRFLNEKTQPLSCLQLVAKFFKLKPRMIFYTPYFRLMMEECEGAEIKLDKLITNYFTAAKKDQFETLADVLKRYIRVDSSFVIFSDELVGLASWSNNDYFKIYLDLFEKARRKRDLKNQTKLAKKALNILPDVDYLNERKKAKIKDYLLRSEG